MNNVVKLLAFVIFVTKMTTVYSTLLGELLAGDGDGDNTLLKLKILGTEKKRGGGGRYYSLANQLTLEASARLADIDRYLLCDCNFQFTANMDEIKLQVRTVSNTLAACDKNKEQKQILQLNLNSLESSIQNMKNRIYSIQSDQPEECKDILKRVLDLLSGLQSFIGRICASM